MNPNYFFCQNAYLSSQSFMGSHLWIQETENAIRLKLSRIQQYLRLVFVSRMKLLTSELEIFRNKSRIKQNIWVKNLVFLPLSQTHSCAYVNIKNGIQIHSLLQILNTHLITINIIVDICIWVGITIFFK